MITIRKSNGKWDAISEKMFPLLIKQIKEGKVNAVKIQTVPAEKREGLEKEIKNANIAVIPGKILNGNNRDFIEALCFEKL